MKENIGGRSTRRMLNGVLVAGVIISTLALTPAAATAADHRVLAWGQNGYYQLGDDVTASRTRPGAISGLTGADVIDLAAGGDNGDGGFGLALLSNGTVEAWGYNVDGQVGDGTSTSPRDVPVQVTGLTDIVAIAAGGFHNLALKSDGTVWAWGYNNDGQLGLGDTLRRYTPVQITGIPKIVAISAGGWHSLAVASDGSVWGWGLNTSGQVGDGSTTGAFYQPVQINLHNVRNVAAGESHSLAVLTDGTVQSWGSDTYGELGDGSPGAPRLAPGPVSSSLLSGIIKVDTTINGSIALGADGTVSTWGRNNYGQLGQGLNPDGNAHSSPAPITTLHNIVDIAGGASHVVALRSDGTVYGWGANGAGQIGDGSTTNRTAPVPVLTRTSGLTTVAAPVGSSFSYAG